MSDTIIRECPECGKRIPMRKHATRGMIFVPHRRRNALKRVPLSEYPGHNTVEYREAMRQLRGGLCPGSDRA